MRRKLLSILALLCLTVSGAWAQWTGGTYTATADEVVSAITVNTDATLTINAGVTVTVNGVLGIQGGQAITVANGKTLTIDGPGTLTVYGLDGADGTDGSDGTNSVAAITGNITVKGATVNAIGGAAGNGGDSSTGTGGKGGTGARGLSNGTVTIYSGTINATGGVGGNGGNSTAGQGGDGGQGGYAFVVTALNYHGGIVNATSGAVGKGGTGSAGNGTTPGRRKAFGGNYLTLHETTGVTLLGDGSSVAIPTPTPATPQITGYYTVNIVPNVTDFGTCGTTGHESDVIWTLTSDGVLTVCGMGAMKDYADKNNQPWSGKRSDIKIIMVTEGVTHIGNRAFSHCEAATSIFLPTTLTSIGERGIETCSSLTSVTIPENVKTIVQYAFQSCENLTSVSLPTTLTSIGQRAFASCTNLTQVTLKSNPVIGSTAIPSKATVTMNLTANSAGGAYWMTFYNQNYKFQADANTQIFKAALEGAGLTLTELTTDKIVNAGKPVILKSTASPIVMTLTSTASGNDFSSNSLQGVATAAGLTAADPSTTFVLNNGTNGVGFYKLKAGKTLGVGKAYLTYSGSSAPSFLGFDETTGIKAIDNGQLTIDNEVYDLQGRRVTQPTKGLYIVNGKKVIIK